MRMDELIASGMVTDGDASILRQAVQERRNILLAGGPGAGKTTLLGALLSEVDPAQRIVGVEDVPELRPVHPQYVRLLTRKTSGAGLMESSVRDLVREALRMRPDRLIVGEVRGPEALDMVTAMTTGMDGSMTTIHASSPEGAMQRLGTLLKMASGSVHADSLARDAIDLVVFIRRDAERRAHDCGADAGSVMRFVRNPTVIIGALVSLFMWILAYIATDSFWLGVPAAVGAGALVGQARAIRIAKDAFVERDEALPLLQSVVPKLRVGLPIDAAFLLACRDQTSPTAQAIATNCARARLGLDLSMSRVRLDTGSLNAAIIAMIAAGRIYGGDTARPFASLSTMIQTDQALRNKQAIASLHVRAQANALIGIAVIILRPRPVREPGLPFVPARHAGRPPDGGRLRKPHAVGLPVHRLSDDAHRRWLAPSV